MKRKDDDTMKRKNNERIAFGVLSTRRRVGSSELSLNRGDVAGEAKTRVHRVFFRRARERIVYHANSTGSPIDRSVDLPNCWALLDFAIHRPVTSRGIVAPFDSREIVPRSDESDFSRGGELFSLLF